MKLIVITTENIFAHEAEGINMLFELGLETLHLRKPGISIDTMKDLLAQISVEYHSRIVLHDYFELATVFNVKGIHLNKRNPVPLTGKKLSLSKSCHTLDEVKAAGTEFNYVFLSPVFNSISKQGYSRAFSPEQLLEAKGENTINEKVIALGGITPLNIPLVKKYGFGGVAVLGSLWGNFAEKNDQSGLLKRFKRLYDTVKND